MLIALTLCFAHTIVCQPTFQLLDGPSELIPYKYFARATSGDGKIIVGYGAKDFNYNYPTEVPQSLLWSEAGEVINLGSFLPNHESGSFYVEDISPDGLMAVGYCIGKGTIYTPSGGLDSLGGAYGYAHGCSNNKIVGDGAEIPFSLINAVYWEKSNIDAMHTLPWASPSTAWDISANDKVIVGESQGKPVILLSVRFCLFLHNQPRIAVASSGFLG